MATSPAKQGHLSRVPDDSPKTVYLAKMLIRDEQNSWGSLSPPKGMRKKGQTLRPWQHVGPS